ncbi:MAG TPA: S8 family serine peptidase, partial [Vicinamibacteria bacterium]|nr:S8 family serine peptidase [Vicinamibacteria bacterium]
MKSRWIVGLMLAAFVFSTSPAAMAAEGDKIVRTKSLNGLPVINTLCALFGCVNGGSLDTTPGSTAPSSLFLVRGLLNNTVNLLLSLLGIATVEEDRPVAIAESGWGNDQATAAVLDQATASVLDRLWDRTPMTYYGSTAWRSYLTQPAAEIVRLRDAHCDLRSTGAGVVAVIDTGVDVDHPTLKPFLVPGYDFTRNVSGGDEKNGVTQATAAVLDGTNWVNGGTAAGVDQATAAVLDDPAHAAFGHGTMVAGMLHLVAPSAKIMPVKAFDASGQGYTSDILRAIYYSVNKGAKVLNMSFSRPTPSAEMKLALDYAALRGVIAVASAGNEGTSQPRYPAAYDNVVGVAATTNDDVRSAYSNYGSKVSMAAPGDGVITTYPFGTFAATWGTSFATPMVSGAAALLVGIQGNASPSQVTWAVTRAKKLTAELGAGRLDAVQAVASGRSMWPW